MPATSSLVSRPDGAIVPGLQDVGDQLDNYLTEEDQKYLYKTGKSVSVLHARRDSLKEELLAARERLAMTKEAREVARLKDELKRTDGVIEEMKARVRGVLERALGEVRKGTRLSTKLREILSLDTPRQRALPQGNNHVNGRA